MKHSSIPARDNTGFAWLPFAALLAGAVLLLSPPRAIAQSAPTEGVPLAVPANAPAAPVQTPPTYQSILDLYQKEVEKETLTLRAEIDRQKASRENTISQVEASVRRVVQESSQATGVKDRAPLLRLKEDAESLKAQLAKEERLLLELRDTVVKKALAQAFDALTKAEAVHTEPDDVRGSHVKAGMQLIRKQRRETLALLDPLCKDEVSKARVRVDQAVSELDKILAPGQAAQPDAPVAYKTVHHKGHSHREPVRADEAQEH